MSFPDSASFPAAATFPAAVSFPAIPTDSVLTLTNAEKLALSLDTPVGTQVSVTDGFVVSGFTEDEYGNGFFTKRGTFDDGRSFYRLATLPYADVGGSLTIFWDGTSHLRSIIREDGGIAKTSSSDVDEPWHAVWDGDFGYGTPVLTHPAVQTLQAPYTAQGGVFVSGGTQDGIYLINPTGQGMINDKVFFGMLGGDYEGDFFSIQWQTNLGTSPMFGNIPSPGWSITNFNDASLSFYSLSDVATPDLASNWKNASDDSPASITVTSITQGELDAGVTVAGAGTATSDGTFVRAGSFNGRNKISKLGDISTFLDWTTDHWELKDGVTLGGDASYYDASNANLANPWSVGIWSIDAGTPPAPTVTRNDVAAEANWVE